jgi:hypothetical protein
MSDSSYSADYDEDYDDVSLSRILSHCNAFALDERLFRRSPVTWDWGVLCSHTVYKKCFQSILVDDVTKINLSFGLQDLTLVKDGKCGLCRARKQRAAAFLSMVLSNLLPRPARTSTATPSLNDAMRTIRRRHIHCRWG